jgi:hypothetical protein
MNYSEQELENYNNYMDFVRNYIISEMNIPEFFKELLEFDVITPQNNNWNFMVSFTYGCSKRKIQRTFTIEVMSFETWDRIRKQIDRREERINELGI